MEKFIFDLVVQGDFYYTPDFKSQEELDDYLGCKCSIKYDDYDAIQNHIKYWKNLHKFSIMEDIVDEYDLEKGCTINAVVYTIDGQYYRLYYVNSLYSEEELWSGPYKVIPVEKTVKVIEYVDEKGR